MKLFILLLSCFCVDFASKFLTYHYLDGYSTLGALYPYGGVPVFQNWLGIDFTLCFVRNTGAAWGIFASWPHLLVAARLVMVTCIIVYVLKYNKNRHLSFPLLLITTGALGNILDYFIYGYVIDMFHFVLWGFDYPVFNVADSLIFIGIAWLVIASYIKTDQKAC